MKGLEDRTRSPKRRAIRFPLLIIMATLPCFKATGSPSESLFTSGSHFPSTLSGRRHFEIDDMTEDECLNLDQSRGAIVGLGREFNLFESRGGDVDNSSFFTEKRSRYSSVPSPSFQRRPSSSRRNGRSGGRSKSFLRPNSSTTAFSANPRSGINRPSPSMFQSIRDWVAAGNLPKIQCRVEPNTTLKVRKTFRPLKTIIKLGADFNTQLGVWQFRVSAAAIVVFAQVMRVTHL